MTAVYDTDAPLQSLDGLITAEKPSVTVSRDTVRVVASVRHTFDARPDPRAITLIRVVVNGRFICDYAQFVDSFDYTEDGRVLTFRWSIPRSAIPFGAGEHDFNLTFGNYNWFPGLDAIHVHQKVELGPRVLPTLVPGKIVRSIFQSQESGVLTDAATQAAFADANVNTVEIGCFRNPVWGGQETTYAEWDAYRQLAVESDFKAAAATGLYLLAIGDEFLRTPQERKWLAETSWAGNATATTRAMCSEYGVIGVEMVDEIDFQTNADGSPLNPTDDPFQLFLANWRTPDAPPIAWPGQYPQRWEPYGGYCSRYKDAHGRIRADGGATLPSMLDAVKRSADRLPPGVPWLGLVSFTGPNYVKRVDGGDYQPGKDTLIASGARPCDVVAEVWLLLAYGACGVRCYFYDHERQQRQRRDGALDQVYQTGIKPGDPQWDAMSNAFGAVADYEELLVGGWEEPYADGPFIVGRRDGLVWYVNATETPALLATGALPGVLLDGANRDDAWAGGYVPPGGVVLMAS